VCAVCVRVAATVSEIHTRFLSCATSDIIIILGMCRILFDNGETVVVATDDMLDWLV
jgi:hypothetical protein